MTNSDLLISDLAHSKVDVTGEDCSLRCHDLEVNLIHALDAHRQCLKLLVEDEFMMQLLINSIRIPLLHPPFEHSNKWLHCVSVHRIATVIAILPFVAPASSLHHSAKPSPASLVADNNEVRHSVCEGRACHRRNRRRCQSHCVAKASIIDTSQHQRERSKRQCGVYRL